MIYVKEDTELKSPRRKCGVASIQTILWVCWKKQQQQEKNYENHQIGKTTFPRVTAGVDVPSDPWCLCLSHTAPTNRVSVLQLRYMLVLIKGKKVSGAMRIGRNRTRLMLVPDVLLLLAELSVNLLTTISQQLLWMVLSVARVKTPANPSAEVTKFTFLPRSDW